MREKDLLRDTVVPTALEKLFKKVTTIRDSLTVDGFVPGRLGQSYNYFGFTAEHKCVSPWFGYSLRDWAIHATPVFLQLRKKWIKTGEEQVLNIARESGFTYDERAEWLLPFQASEIETWDLLLREVLTKLAVASGGAHME